MKYSATRLTSSPISPMRAFRERVKVLLSILRSILRHYIMAQKHPVVQARQQSQRRGMFIFAIQRPSSGQRRILTEIVQRSRILIIAGLTQLVECLLPKQNVVGSNP